MPRRSCRGSARVRYALVRGVSYQKRELWFHAKGGRSTRWVRSLSGVEDVEFTAASLTGSPCCQSVPAAVRAVATASSLRVMRPTYGVFAGSTVWCAPMICWTGPLSALWGPHSIRTREDESEWAWAWSRIAPTAWLNLTGETMLSTQYCGSLSAWSEISAPVTEENILTVPRGSPWSCVMPLRESR